MWLLILAYLIIGYKKVRYDFARPIINRPSYTYEPNLLMIIAVILTWPIGLWIQRPRSLKKTRDDAIVLKNSNKDVESFDDIDSEAINDYDQEWGDFDDEVDLLFGAHLKPFSKLEKHVFYLESCEDMTINEIASNLKLSEAQVSEILRKISHHLRRN